MAGDVATIIDLERTPARAGPSDDALASGCVPRLERVDQLLGHLVDTRGLEDAVRRRRTRRRCRRRRQPAGRVGDDRREHLLEIERGARRLADLAERLELVDAILQLLEAAARSRWR